MQIRKLLSVLILLLISTTAIFTVQAVKLSPDIAFSCAGSGLKIDVSNFGGSNVDVTVNGNLLSFNSNGSQTFNGSGSYSYSAKWGSQTLASGNMTCTGTTNLTPPHNDGRLFDSQDANGDIVIPFCDSVKGVVLRWVSKDANGDVITTASGGWSFEQISKPEAADDAGNSEISAVQSKAGVGSAHLYKLADGSLQLNITDVATGKTVARKIECSQSV